MLCPTRMKAAELSYKMTTLFLTVSLRAWGWEEAGGLDYSD